MCINAILVNTFMYHIQTRTFMAMTKMQQEIMTNALQDQCDFHILKMWLYENHFAIYKEWEAIAEINDIRNG